MSHPWVASVTLPASLGLVTAWFLGMGCSVTGRAIDMTRLGPASKILVYRSGNPVVERSVAADSEECRAIDSWLKAHGAGWRADLNSYAPGHLIRGERFSLDFHEDRCILNYQIRDGGDWSQVSRPILGAEPIPDVFAPSKGAP